MTQQWINQINKTCDRGIYTQENANICPHKGLYMSICSSIIHNQNVETQSPSTDEWLNKMSYLYSGICKKECSTDTWFLDEPWKHAEWKNSVAKGHLLARIGKSRKQFPGAGGSGEWRMTANRFWVSFVGRWKYSENRWWWWLHNSVIYEPAI